MENSRLLVLLNILFFLIVVGCSSDDNASATSSVLTDFDLFTLDLPNDWEVLDYPVEEIGGLISDGADSLFYDYGVWAFDNLVDLDLQIIDTIENQTLQINNEEALIIIGQRINENRITYNYLIDKLDQENKIRYISYNAIDEPAIREIVMTHRFK